MNINRYHLHAKGRPALTVQYTQSRFRLPQELSSQAANKKAVTLKTKNKQQKK
jgi:hypothetical protein